MSQKTLRGISASTGIAIGPVWRYEVHTRAVAGKRQNSGHGVMSH
jgi:hypothetical protein